MRVSLGTCTCRHAPVTAPADVCYQLAGTCCLASLPCLALPCSLPLPSVANGSHGTCWKERRGLCVLHRRCNLFFLTAGRITSEVITCNADLSLLEMAFFFFLCLRGGFCILACYKTFGCLWFLAEWTLVEQIWPSWPLARTLC